VEVFFAMNYTVEKISGCAGLQQAKEETSAPLSCFSTLSMSSTPEQSDMLRKADAAQRHYPEVAATNTNVLQKPKNGKASSGKRRCVLLMAEQPEDLSAQRG